MKSAVEQLSTYKSVHLNKTNIKTHFVGIPTIIWSLVVWFSLINLPFELGDSGYSLTLAVIFFTGVAIYYFMLNVSLAIGNLVFIIPIFYSAHLVAQMPNAGWIAAAVFIFGWGFQFVGHYYEKAKPAFVDDLNQLLIGPFFLLAEVFFMLGKQKKLEEEITSLAIEKRRIFEAKQKLKQKQD